MIELVLAVFATYRIARMIALEEGAFGVFSKIREHFDPEQSTWLGRGLNCPLCIGFWVAAVMAGITIHLRFGYINEYVAVVWLLRWLGVAGAQVVLHNWSEK